MRDTTIRLKLDISDLKAKAAAAAAETKRLEAEVERSNKRSTQRQLRESRAAQRQAERAVRDAQRLQVEQRQALSEIGGTFGKVGLAAGAAGALSVRAFANFDEAMSAVKATGKDAAANIAELRDLAIDMGAKTKFNATESAGAITSMAKAGVSAKDILGGGLAGALDLAAAGGLEVGEAAEIAATAMNQFGLAGADVPHIADVLAAAAGKAMGEVSDMGQAFKYVGPVAKQMGISLEETGGTIAYLAQQGVLGDQAGTSLRGMLSSLTSPSKIAAKTMKELGINVYDAQGKFVGFDGVAGELQENLSKLSNSERDAALGRIFGNEQITTARLLYEGGSKSIQKWTKAVDDQGFAAETAATKMDNLKGDIEEFTGGLETALIGTGEGADGPLRDLVQTLTSLVEVYNDLPGPAKEATLGALGLTAAVGGGTWAITRAITAYANLQDNLGALGGGFETSRKKALLFRGGALAAGAGLSVLSDDIGEFDRNAGIATDALSGMAVGFAVGGPWGSAIGGAIGLIKGFGDAHADAEAQVEALITTYDKATGKMTEAARAKAVENLNKPLKEGLFGTGFGAVEMTGLEAAKTAGVELRTITDAAMGSGRAIQEVTARFDELRGMAKRGTLDEEADRLGVSTYDLADAIAFLGEHVDKNSEKWKEAGQRARDGAIATSGEIKTTKQFAAAVEDLPDAVQTEIKLLGYKPSALQLEDLIRRYNLTPEQVQTLLAALDRATPLIDRVEAKRNRLDGSAANIRLQAIDAATAAINAARYALRSLDGDSATVHIRTQRGPAKPGSQAADGGTWENGVRKYADGGFDEFGRPVRRVPQIRSGTQGTVMWGEPETGWEAYVSGKPSQKPRNRAILSEAATRLGGAVQWFADGGFTEALSQREYAGLRARERELTRAMREKEKYGKGNKKKRLALRGWDRVEAAAELRELRAEIAEQNKIRRQIGPKKKYRTAGAYNRAMQKREDAAEKRRDDAEAAKQDRQSIAGSFANGLDGDAFKSPASLERALKTLERDNAEYVTLLAQLAKAGASPFLLDQIRTKATPSRQTNRTLRALLGDTARIHRMNASGAGIITSANNFAALTTGKGFTVGYSGAAGFSQAQLDAITAAINAAQIRTTVSIGERPFATAVQAAQKHGEEYR